MVTKNIAAAATVPVRDAATAVPHGAREGRPSAPPLADLAASFQNILNKSVPIDGKDMRASTSLAHSAARDRISTPPSGRDDAPASDADPADDDDEWEVADRTRDLKEQDPTETPSGVNRPADVEDPHIYDAEDLPGAGDAGVSDGSLADAGNDSARAAPGASSSAPAAGASDDAVDPIGSNARGRETTQPQPNPNQRGEANLASATADDGVQLSVKAGAAARQANELAKSLTAGEDLKINVAVSKPGDSLFSQPASSLAATSLGAGQKNSSRPGQVPVGASAKAGFAGGLNPAQGSATVQPNIQVNGQSGAGDLQLQTGTQGSQANLVAAPSRNAGNPASASASSFADVAGIGTSGAPQAGQRAGSGQVPTADKPPSPHPPVTEQISVQISKAVKAGIDRIDIHLRPKSLGRVEVRLELAGDGRVSATVTVDIRETLDLLKTDARGLEKALDDAGLKADSNSLSFNLRGQDGRPSGNPLSRTNHPDGSHGGNEAELHDDGPARTLGDYSRGGLSADGRLDIEI